ncbi:response regulator [Cohnella sp. GCM10027633]|uniref:response regulator transcription factor n=1 Tax=unclassified Cohnella TaxID=2636738 RepID=UPI003629E7E4
MYRLLIVDDEPYILNSLVDLFASESDILEIYTAGSAEKALERLNKQRMDIVLTDIQMPGMNGLDLLVEIRGRWPLCKTIFLTGYHEFDYVRTAIREGGVDYLLKTEDSSVILQAIRKAIAEIDDQRKAQRLLSLSDSQRHKIVPLLQREYLLSLMQGQPSTVESRRLAFAESELPLDPEADVFALLVRIDQWDPQWTPHEKELMLFAIRNIAEEYLKSHVRIASTVIGPSKYIWLLQPRLPNQWLLFVKEHLSDIQATCRDLLRIPVSFAVSKESVPWEKLPDQAERLNRLLLAGPIVGTEFIVIESDDSEQEDSKGVPLSSDKEADDFRKVGHRLISLETSLESGNRTEFMHRLDEIGGLTRSLPPALYMQTYYSIATLLLKGLNQWKPKGYSELLADVVGLYRVDQSSGANETWERLRDTSGRLFDARENETEAETDQLVAKLHRYILSNLDGDVSLPRLAEVVYLNHVYLCRLYKQKTGIGLSDYMMNVKITRAKELLAEPQWKVHEIAAKVGYDSTPSFTRFFKRHTNMAPQEYRDSVIHAKEG